MSGFLSWPVESAKKVCINSARLGILKSQDPSGEVEQTATVSINLPLMFCAWP